MVARLRFFQGTDLHIFGIKFLVAIGVLIQIEYRAGEETQEGVVIFVLLLHRRRLVHRLGFHHLHAAADQGIFHFDFNALAVHTDIDMVLLGAYRIKRRRENFLYDPVAVRDILKGKATILGGGDSKQRVFLGKFFGIRLKQAHDRAGQLHIFAALRVFTDFHAVHTPAQEVIGNSLTLVDKNLYQCRLLAGIFKNNRIFGIREDIGAVCGAFLHIVAAKRQVGGKGSVIAARLICRNGDHLQEPTRRDHAAVKSRQVSGRIQAERNIFIFLIHAKPKEPVRFQRFKQAHIHLLALVIQTNRGLRHFHGLPRIGKLRIFRLGV